MVFQALETLHGLGRHFQLDTRGGAALVAFAEAVAVMAGRHEKFLNSALSVYAKHATTVMGMALSGVSGTFRGFVAWRRSMAMALTTN